MPMTAAGSSVFFAADDGVIGGELWRSDGTAAGTVAVANLWVGPWSSSPRNIVLSGGRVIFSANNGIAGDEPWAVFPGATAQPIGSPCAGAGRSPTLRTTDPEFGTVFTITADDGVPGAPVFLLAGLPAQLTPLGAGCLLYLASSSFSIVHAVVPVGPTWQVAFPLPVVPWLHGVTIVLQAIQAPTNAPLGADLTNAVFATFAM